MDSEVFDWLRLLCFKLLPLEFSWLGMLRRRFNGEVELASMD